MKSNIEEKARVNHKKKKFKNTKERSDSVSPTIEDILINLFLGDSSNTESERIEIRTEKTPKILEIPTKVNIGPIKESAKSPTKIRRISDIKPKIKPKIIGRKMKYILLPLETNLEVIIEAKNATNHIKIL